MIKYLRREEINIEKYNACIDQANGSRIYGYAWYLDAVADQWDVLVAGDYEAVMPLPKRKKYGLAYVYRLPWVQQLGLFSKVEISQEQFNLFLKAIPRKFKYVDLMINASNPLISKHITKRTNYILNLNEPYSLLKKAYSKGRKSSIKKGKTILQINHTHDISAIIDLYRENIGIKTGQGTDEYKRLISLMKSAEKRNAWEPYEVLNEHNTVIGGAIFIKNDDRIVYLLSAINQEGRDKQAMSLLLNHIIEKYAESKLTLDFEGSTIPEIASFIRSFGAVEEHYGHFRRKRIF